MRSGYRFLVENYEPGDELYFFGFSRGAFTARSTAGLVRNSGILRAAHVDRIKDAYALYRARGRRSHPRGIEAQIFRQMYSHPDPEIHFVGVWDTVGALGHPDRRRAHAVDRKRWSFHDTTLSSHVRFAFQALAIDEQRGPFRPTLWEQQEGATGQTLEQLWFAGVHSDVGGGYSDPGLAEIPLLWMVERARECGLAFDVRPLPRRDRRHRPGAAPPRRTDRARRAGGDARVAQGLLPRAPRIRAPARRRSVRSGVERRPAARLVHRPQRVGGDLLAEMATLRSMPSAGG